MTAASGSPPPGEPDALRAHAADRTSAAPALDADILRPRRLAAVLAFGFSLTLVSNTLEPGVLGHKVLQLAPGAPNTTLGFTTFAGLLVAIVAQPVIGALSDRTRSRWGRRLPYLAGGTLLLIACLYLVAAAPAMAILLVALLAAQLGANSIQAPAQALIPDHVGPGQRGRVAGLKAALDIAAFVIGRLAAGLLLGLTPRWGEVAVLAAVSVPAVVLVMALAITAAGAGETAGGAGLAGAPDPPPAAHRPRPLAAVLRIDLRAHPAFGWWFANRLLFWTAFLLLNTFLLFFVIDVHGVPEAEAQRLISQLSALLGGLLAVAALAASGARSGRSSAGSCGPSSRPGSSATAASYGSSPTSSARVHDNAPG